MAILYSVIARGETILCSHSTSGGNFDEVAGSMLPNIPTRNDAKTTYTSHNYLFHVMVENGIIYLCASETESGRRQPYAFLAEIRRQLTSSGLFSRVQFAHEWDLQAEYADVLASQMERFSNPESDKLNVLQSQVDEVKDIMTQNIEGVLRRGENLETLMDKTTDLEASIYLLADLFSSVSGQKCQSQERRVYKSEFPLIMAMHQCTVVMNNAPAIYSSSEQRPPARMLVAPPPMCPKGMWFYQELARHPILYHTTYAPRSGTTQSMWKSLRQTPQGISRLGESSLQGHGYQGYQNNQVADEPPSQVVPLWCAPGCPVKTANSYSSNVSKATLLKAEPVVVPSDIQIENQSETYHNVVDGNAVVCNNSLRNSCNNLFYGGCMYSSIYDAVDSDDRSQMSLSQFIEQDSGIDSMRSNVITPGPSGEEEEEEEEEGYSKEQQLSSMTTSSPSQPPSSRISDNRGSDNGGSDAGLQEASRMNGSNISSTAMHTEQSNTRQPATATSGFYGNMSEDNAPSSTSTEVQQTTSCNEKRSSGEYKVSIDHSYSSLMSVDFQGQIPSLSSERYNNTRAFERNSSDYFRSATPIDGYCDPHTDKNFRSSTPIELLSGCENVSETANLAEQKDTFEEAGFKVESTNDIVIQSPVISSALGQDEVKSSGTGEDVSTDDERLLICISKDDLDDTEIIFTNEETPDMECTEEDSGVKDEPFPCGNFSMTSDKDAGFREPGCFHSDGSEEDPGDSYYDASLSRLSKEGKLPSFLGQSDPEDDEEGINSTEPFSLVESLKSFEDQNTGLGERDSEDKDGVQGRDMEQGAGDFVHNEPDVEYKSQTNPNVDDQTVPGNNSGAICISTNGVGILTDEHLNPIGVAKNGGEEILEQSSDMADVNSAYQNNGDCEERSLKLPHIQELLHTAAPSFGECAKKAHLTVDSTIFQKPLSAKAVIVSKEQKTDNPAGIRKSRNSDCSSSSYALSDGILKSENLTQNISSKLDTIAGDFNKEETVKKLKTFAKVIEDMKKNSDKPRVDMETTVATSCIDDKSCQENGVKVSTDVEIQGSDCQENNSSKESLWQPWKRPLKEPEKVEGHGVFGGGTGDAVTKESDKAAQVQQTAGIFIHTSSSVTSHSFRQDMKKQIDVASNNSSSSIALSNCGNSGSFKQPHASLQYSVDAQTASEVSVMSTLPPGCVNPVLPTGQRKFLPSLAVNSSCVNLYKSGMLMFSQHGTTTSNLPSFEMFKQATPRELQMWNAFNPLLTQHQYHLQQQKLQMNTHTTSSTNVAVVNPTGVNTTKQCQNTASSKTVDTKQDPTSATKTVTAEKTSTVDLKSKTVEVRKSSVKVENVASLPCKPLATAQTMCSSVSDNEALTAKKPAKSLNPLAVYWMTEWLNRHMANPYPTTMEKKHLAKAGSITMAQVSSWFANKRARMGIKGKKMPSVPSQTETTDNLIVEATKNVQLTPGSVYVGCYPQKQKSQFPGIAGKENTASGVAKVKDGVFRIGKHKRGLSDVSNIGLSSSSDVVHHTAKKQKVHSEG